jgi:signal transduction histidine kinase
VSTARPGSAAEQVETTLFRALAAVRTVLLVYAVTLNVARRDDFERPWLVLTCVLVMVAWSGFVTWAYDDPARRRLGLYVADLAVGSAVLLATPYAESAAMLDRHAATISSFWVIAPVLAWSAGRGLLEGLVAALVVAVADLSVRTSPDGGTWGNIFLLLLAAAMVGYAGAILREAAEARAAAERATAAMAERTRLSRVVHDGVLQVLALVQRRGQEVGGDAELGRLAAEQERALRALIQGEARSAAALEPGAAPGTDVVLALSALGSPTVTVAGPGHPVPLTPHQVAELVGAVGACLDNVAAHVGPAAPAWVLVEDLGEVVVVSVRDQGGGIPPGRLDAAVREGRLGVSSSIVGRLADLGGTAVQVAGPGEGTEWELTVPRA